MIINDRIIDVVSMRAHFNASTSANSIKGSDTSRLTTALVARRSPPPADISHRCKLCSHLERAPSQPGKSQQCVHVVYLLPVVIMDTGRCMECSGCFSTPMPAHDMGGCICIAAKVTCSLWQHRIHITQPTPLPSGISAEQPQVIIAGDQHAAAHVAGGKPVA